MSKSQKTYELEEIITLATARADRIGCPEVGLGDYGIVDYISMDIRGAMTIRCYELKISKSDFLSDAKKTFVGDFNYYVIPSELWMDVKGHVEKGIGVWTVDGHGHVSVKKKAMKRKCLVSRKKTLGLILRALNRENLKHCEENWRRRQADKKVQDANGGGILPGDIVEYHGVKSIVVSIEYARDQMELRPICTIRPIEEPNGETIKEKPSILHKIPVTSLTEAEKNAYII